MPGLTNMPDALKEKIKKVNYETNQQTTKKACKLQPGFYTKLIVLGSLGLNFDYDGGPIIENGGPILLYKRRILEGSTSFHEGIQTGLSCQTGVAKHQVIFVSQPFVAT